MKATLVLLFALVAVAIASDFVPLRMAVQENNKLVARQNVCTPNVCGSQETCCVVGGSAACCAGANACCCPDQQHCCLQGNCVCKDNVCTSCDTTQKCSTAIMF
eukprot:TRINITY_DN14282_c0_g1_i1.p2 TRINITY_DN14282_c0_g1~~TRINITY_DN14282_c0_g1_i1.p2  ORF type:complete len:115 (+),score=15.29 TRINITY_DN14282_c0_g1_i1:35-346(+)